MGLPVLAMGTGHRLEEEMQSQASPATAPPVDVAWEHIGSPNGNRLLSHPRIVFFLLGSSKEQLIFSVLGMVLCTSHTESHLFPAL